MDRDILLACRDASLGYEHRALLEHLTFTVRAGDYLCVVGENGSGKSTLMKSLLGLLPPLAGSEGDVDSEDALQPAFSQLIPFS